jgi:hypothetical protein
MIYQLYAIIAIAVSIVIFEMKRKAEELKEFYDKVQNREMSIAQTNLEQAMMWATKAWVKEGDKINESK